MKGLVPLDSFKLQLFCSDQPIWVVNLERLDRVDVHMDKWLDSMMWRCRGTHRTVAQ